MWRFQNELSYASSITGSPHMHFKFKKQAISQNVSLMKFQKVVTKSLISVFPKLVFKYIGNGTLLENGLRIWVSPCLKVNYGVGDFGLLFMCPSLDYPVSPNYPIVPSTLEHINPLLDRTDHGLRLQLIWHIVKDFGLFCLCFSLWFVVFRPSFPKFCHVPNTLKQVWLSSNCLAFTLE